MTPNKQLFLTFAMQNYSQQFQNTKLKTFLGDVMFENLRISEHENVQHKRAGKSFRSVLSDLKNLEYEINIYQRNMIFKFGIEVEQVLSFSFFCMNLIGERLFNLEPVYNVPLL